MKIELNIPTSLNDLTLGQYQKYISIAEPTEQDLVVCFLDLTLDQVNSIKVKDFTMIVERLTELFKEEKKHHLKFKLDGVKYGFIPNLDEISYGENKDVTTYINNWETMHQALSVLYRPIKQELGSKYLIEDYTGKEDAELFKDVPLDIAMGAYVFFWNLTNELLTAIPSFLLREATKSQVDLDPNGEVLVKSIHSLKEILQDLMKLPNSHYTFA